MYLIFYIVVTVVDSKFTSENKILKRHEQNISITSQHALFELKLFFNICNGNGVSLICYMMDKKKNS